MRGRIIFVMLIVCGFAVTTGEASAALVEDRLEAIENPQNLRFATTGPATLTGIIPQPDAADWLKAQQGKSVFVRSSGQDRYGRTRVIVLESRKRNAQSWQEELLRNGLALVYDRAAAPKKWLMAEEEAHTSQRGLWNITALTPVDAAQHIGQLVRIEGTVTRSFKSRDMYYVNFGEDWREDFSLRIPRRAWRSFGEHLLVTDGARVLVRGVVFLDNGPMIEITRPEQMQITPSVAPKLREPRAAGVSDSEGGKVPLQGDTNANPR